LPLLFRARAGERWRLARTVTISRDGVSFAARRKLPIGARLDMRFIVGGRASSVACCKGRVVRLKTPERDSESAVYGATIDHYRLQPMSLSGFP
jgi:hypothetical protein